MADVKNLAAVSQKNNWPVLNSVAAWSNWDKSSTVIKVVKLIGTLLVFPLLIAGFFDIVKKGYDAVWGEKKQEEPAKSLSKPARFWNLIKDNKVTNGISKAASFTAEKVSNHKKALIIGAALVGTGAATWYFAGSYIGASICNLTGYFCVANTEASATPPKAEVPKV